MLSVIMVIEALPGVWAVTVFNINFLVTVGGVIWVS
jgi:hypothetical protein